MICEIKFTFTNTKLYTTHTHTYGSKQKKCIFVQSRSDCVFEYISLLWVFRYRHTHTPTQKERERESEKNRKNFYLLVRTNQPQRCIILRAILLRENVLVWMIRLLWGIFNLFSFSTRQDRKDSSNVLRFWSTPHSFINFRSNFFPLSILFFHLTCVNVLFFIVHPLERVRKKC